MRWGIYIHIPFCRRKCLYCDFPSVAGEERLMPRYVEALCSEIAAWGRRIEHEGAGAASTVYVGGGTPTALPPDSIIAILRELSEAIPLREDAEITVEANPGTVSREGFFAIRRAGVNRMSLGVQSFSDVMLRRIGRIHTAVEARAAVDMARQAGLQNIGIDLMYGLPGQSLEDLEISMEEAVSLGVQHISIYGLQVEEGTPFAEMQARGELALPSERVAEAMYDAMVDTLPRHGYRRYEISNFALPGRESRHNLGYWQDVPYIGIGAAAHSYWGGMRLENIRDPAAYIEAVEAGHPVSCQEEPVTREIAMEEFSFLALRTTDGISRKSFREKFGSDLASVYGEVIRRMAGKGLLEEDESRVRLTALGMKYGNVVFREFLL